MENEQQLNPAFRYAVFAFILGAVGVVAFAAGIAWSSRIASADDSGAASGRSGGPRVVYPKKTELDFEGLAIQGELKSPGEFYFQHREEEKFDSLVKRRKNFHREMLRDGLMSP
ncbi:MAG: hypothetical protein P4M08_12950 [Oligoflexia bacterium]|nr:hypothetical protein [Oligoflexia bacterium]